MLSLLMNLFTVIGMLVSGKAVLSAVKDRDKLVKKAKALGKKLLKKIRG